MPPMQLSPLTPNIIQLVEKQTSLETEAFVRREMVAFLVSYHSTHLRHLQQNTNSPLADESSNLFFFTSINFFCHLVSIDLDWQVQLNCLDFIRFVFRLVTTNLDNYKTPNQKSPAKKNITTTIADNQSCANVSSKYSGQFRASTPIEIVFFHSDCLKTLVNLVNADFCHDRSVLCYAADLLLKLKQNEVLCALLAKTSSPSESQNGFVLLNSLAVENLEAFVAESRLSTDLYTRQPVAILDDIMASYQFDLDDEKAVDCY
jgi:hypothetical protein